MKIVILLSKLAQNILAPVACIVCKKHDSYLCSDHEKYLLWYPNCCYLCQSPTEHSQNCLEHPWPISWVIVGFYYTRIVQYIVARSKYSGSYHLLSYLAQKLSLLIVMNHYLSMAYKKQTIIVTYIPMYPHKEFYQRWYNQAQKLAQYIADLLWVQSIPLLKKIRSTKTQIKKDRKHRQKQNSTIYEIIPTDLPANTTIILVDDIITTWTTLVVVAQKIKDYFPDSQIRWVCIARNT